MTCGTKRRTQKLGQHILCYVSKFRRYGAHSSSVIVILKPKNYTDTKYTCTRVLFQMALVRKMMIKTALLAVLLVSVIGVIGKNG